MKDNFGFLPMKFMRAKISCFLMVAFICGPAFAAGRGDSTVIRYYLKNLDSAYAKSYIFASGTAFSFKIRIIYEETSYRGTINKADTAAMELYFSAGKRDSLEIIDSAQDEKNIIPDSFAVPPVWRHQYDYSFYPNDTGAGILAIGFDRQSNAENPPVGFLTMDRDTYYLKSLFLSFPEKEGYRQYSRTYHFERFDDYYIPTIWEIDGSMNTFTGIKYFKQILEFKEFKLGDK
ncbi:exported hypothetical protein [Candidatus Zixiibacteriota bacterium]|nr:exported hypothetical protein [candidate division Zixibacteria bacterium]